SGTQPQVDASSSTFTAQKIMKHGPPPPQPTDVPIKRDIRILGIADLQVVKQELLAYKHGEVADIKNMLKGEERGEHVMQSHEEDV
ncbi:hypothetical protein ABTF88_20295, partial [Acinetobacter baumannii]